MIQIVDAEAALFAIALRNANMVERYLRFCK